MVVRIQALAMNEAARLVEEGVATAGDVDKAVGYGFGLRFAALGFWNLLIGAGLIFCIIRVSILKRRCKSLALLRPILLQKK